MKIVVSVDNVGVIDEVLQYDPTFIEIRLDLMEGDLVEQVKAIRRKTNIPLIATLRSKVEGGRFVGDANLWIRVVGSVAKFVDMVDVEARYRDHAPFIHSQGVRILASLHTTEMPTRPELANIDSTLRSYGDIPKIVVKPRTQDDVFELVSFTFSAPKPICTGIMGSEFRYARAILPLFGSEFVYCHAGRPTADGQYHVREGKLLDELLR
jgi:3-dehydroquinate dehydratase-1